MRGFIPEWKVAEVRTRNGQESGSSESNVVESVSHAALVLLSDSSYRRRGSVRTRWVVPTTFGISRVARRVA